MPDLAALLANAQEQSATGTMLLSPTDLARLAAWLEMDPALSFLEKNRLLRILGLVGYPADYEPVVAAFLQDTTPTVAETALHVLCDYWGVTAHYLPQIARFIRGVPWDEWAGVQVEAIAVATAYLSHQAEPRLLRAIIAVAEYPDTRDEQDAYTGPRRARDHAYHALGMLLEDEDSTDPELLARAKERLRQDELEQPAPPEAGAASELSERGSALG